MTLIFCGNWTRTEQLQGKNVVLTRKSVIPSSPHRELEQRAKDRDKREGFELPDGRLKRVDARHRNRNLICRSGRCDGVTLERLGEDGKAL